MVPMGFGLADQEENRVDNDSVESAVDIEDSVDNAQEDNIEASYIPDNEEDAPLKNQKQKKHLGI